MEATQVLRLPFTVRACLRPRSSPKLSSSSINHITPRRQLSRSATRQADSITIPPPDAPRSPPSIGALGQSLGSRQSPAGSTDKVFTGSVLDYIPSGGGNFDAAPHHLHVFATKHNTHLTLTKPNRQAIISISCGNLGFRKAARGTYDASYQLGSYMMNRIASDGLLAQIDALELILRGYGPGRDAVTKILLGNEGMMLRPRIVKVTDATRLKFGGTRSKKPRRL